jgi:hypothetical protein
MLDPDEYLIEPFAVVVEDVDALVADGAVLGALRGDGDVAQVAAAILDHVLGVNVAITIFR